MLAAIPALIAVNAYAGLDLHLAPGRQTITQTGGERTDYCFLPKTLPGFPYREKSLRKDQETEAELCGYDLYATNTRLAACPKLNSTNPGIKIFELDKEVTDRKKWEAAECPKEDGQNDGSTVAKFKQTMTCSYAPSPMAYYQISRVLDAQPIVPVAVLRTMDARTHLEYVKKGAAYATKIYGDPETHKGEALLQAWAKKWPAAHQTKPDSLFDAGGTQVWGDLVESPKGKEVYKEVFTKPGQKFHYDTRYEDFKGTPVYQKLASAKPLAPAMGTDFAQMAQPMVQLKDVSDMIVLDYLLNQQDRMGNIHYVPYYLYVENGKIKDKKVATGKSAKKKAKAAEQAAEMKAKGAVIVKRMVLADNDCGVAKDNLIRENEILDGLNHMGLDTYRRLLWLSSQLQTNEWQSYFRSELQFTQGDLTANAGNRSGLVVNAANAVKILQEKCRKGTLQLDLNFSLQLQGKNITDSKPYCDLPADYQPGA
jgi:hypothetical protein